MYTSAKPYFYGTGRRKKSVARVRLYPGSGAITIKGPAGEVTIEEGVIAAKRHIHMTPEDAEKMGLKDGQNVSVKIEGERGVIFNETVLRVSEKFATAMHIDTDEANAVCLPREAYGVIVD